MARTILLVVLLAAIGFFLGEHTRAQTQRTVSTPETAISDQIRHLRSLPDDVRARTTKQLAIDIRRLPATLNKLHLGISDEDRPKVKQLLAERSVTYPILLDPGRKVNQLFRIEGIPKGFLYDRNGKMVSQAIDMRTQGQFLRMLAQAGLH